MDTIISWKCSLLYYSGLKNPEWEISARAAGKLLNLLSENADTVTHPFTDELSGYKGCVLKSPEGVYFRAFNGVVRKNDNGIISYRKDKNRKFERGILLTVPSGILGDIKIDF